MNSLTRVRKSKLKEPSMIVKNLSVYLNSIKARINQHYVETDKGCYYILEGRKVSMEEMNAIFPIVEMEKIKVYKGKGLDSRTNFY